MYECEIVIATDTEGPLETQAYLDEVGRTALLKLGCRIVEEDRYSLVYFPVGTVRQLTVQATNSHYTITFPDGREIGAEYSRWLGVDGQYLFKLPRDCITAIQ